MALDPRRLRPSELAMLLNSTPLGQVIDEMRLHRQRVQAGLRIGDGKTVHLIRYIVWLTDQAIEAQPPRGPEAGYEALKERATERNRRLSLVGRDIGKLPPVVNPERRAAASRDFRAFCDAYFGKRFYLPWSPDHVRVLARAQACMLEGGQFALAMPRGSGKTSIIEAAVLFAVLYGHRVFPVLIGASQAHAEELLASLITEIEVNEPLGEDFPEVCFPIRALDGIAHRCAGQLCEGERTLISWTQNEIVLPTIKGSVASAAIVKVAGLTGRIRGMKFTRPDGKSVRPDLAICDDPQTDESAASLSQCATRERILAHAVLGLAGPAEKIAALMPCTVIRQGDVADHILDRDLHPEWNGERTKLVYEFPTAVKLWEQYGEIRGESLRRHGDIRDATEFYRANRAAMDDGAVVAWPERFNGDEISALQHAMNLRLADEAAFFAEMQNDPLTVRADAGEDVALLSAEEIAKRLSLLPQGVVPLQATRLTAAVDVQQRLLYWSVVAWADDFTGWVVDYGTFPEQDRERFTYADAQKTLGRLTPGAGVEGQLQVGLQALLDDLCGTEWVRENGAPMCIERCLIDANWHTSTEIIYHLARRSEHAELLTPSHGSHFGLSARPLSEAPKNTRDRSGYGWRMPAEAPAKLVRFDAGMWKTFVHSRLATKPGDPGSLTLFGKAPARHRMLAEQLTSETRERLRGPSRVVDVWTLLKHRDNHLLDTLVGCAVAASIQGAALSGMEAAKQPRARRKVSMSELQQRRRQGREMRAS